MGHTNQPFGDSGALMSHLERLAEQGETGSLAVVSRASGDVVVEVDLDEARGDAVPQERWGHRTTWIRDSDRERYDTALIARLDEIEANGEKERVVHMSTQVLAKPNGDFTYVAQIITLALYSFAADDR